MWLIHWAINLAVWIALAFLAIALELGDAKKDAALAIGTAYSQSWVERHASDFIGGKKGFVILLFGPLALAIFFMQRAFFNGWRNTFKGLSFALPPKGTSWL